MNNMILKSHKKYNCTYLYHRCIGKKENNALKYMQQQLRVVGLQTFLVFFTPSYNYFIYFYIFIMNVDHFFN